MPPAIISPAASAAANLTQRCLLMPEIGIVRYDDPRFCQTLAALERGLLRDGLMMRYTDADDFGEPETAFIICTFWYIDALAACGRRDEALRCSSAFLPCAIMSAC